MLDKELLRGTGLLVVVENAGALEAVFVEWTGSM